MRERRILIISGTNRPGSHAKKIAQIVENHYKTREVPTDFLSLEDLPREMFEASAYANKPPAIVALQARVLDAAGLHVVTPEYNGSFPGVLKYFIDMLKFPESFERKPVAFVGVAAGIWGALRAVEHLQQIFGYRNAHIYPDRVFMPGVNKLLSAEGKLIDPALDERLARQAAGFAKFAHAIAAHHQSAST